MVSAAISSFTSTNVVSTTGTDITTKDTQSGLDFSKIMTSSISSNAKNQNSTSSGKLTDGITSTNAQSTKNTSDSKNTTTSKTDSTSSGSSKTDNVSKSDNTAKTTDSSSEELNDKISEAVSKIKDKIKSELNVSDEEIASAMSALSMTAADLLSTDNVTQLVSQLEGTSTLDLITDGSLLQSLNNILDTVSSQLEIVSDDAGINADDVINLAKESGFDVALSDVTGDTDRLTDTKQVSIQDTVVDSDTDTVDESSDSLGDVLSSKTVVVDTKETDNDTSKNSDSDSQADSKSSDSKLDVNQFGSNLANSVTDALEQITADTDLTVNETDILRQVVEQVRVSANEQLQSIEVILNPENLGTVHVTVSAKEGIVTAQLTATNEQVKAALENQVIQLKEQFNNQGLKVDSVEVTVQSHSFEANENMNDNSANQNSQSRRSTRRLDLSSLDDLSDEDMSDDEIRARDSLVHGDSSVVYQA